MNIQHPTSKPGHPIDRRATLCSALDVGCWMLNLRILSIICIFLAFIGSTAAQTNAPSKPDYSSFRIITDRNIFNPNRTGRYIRSSNNNAPRPSRVDTFSLVGTIAYEKGRFAFFDGTSSDFRQVLEPSGQIAGYTVKEITPQSVKLEADGKALEMKVGAQMRREDNKSWELIAQTEWTPTATADSAATTSNDSSLEANDVLKKLMQQREQESK
jgi:hypothetical protein